MLGSWTYCNVLGVERRRAEDGNLFSAKEFKDYYDKDGRDKWVAAKSFVEKRVTSDRALYSAAEHRSIAVDAIGEHGWVDAWNALSEETRLAEDGKGYMFSEFSTFYSANAIEKWNSATSEKSPISALKMGCRCTGSAGKHGYCGFHFHIGSGDDKPWCRTRNSCGERSFKGSWMYCDHLPVEQRRGDNGSLHTAKEFRQQHGKDGAQRWQAAKPFVEKRVDLGRNYTVHEFRDYYVDAWGEQGWHTKWLDASPETRLARDGKWYTWEQFVSYYAAQAWDEWKATLQNATKDAKEDL